MTLERRVKPANKRKVRGGQHTPKRPSDGRLRAFHVHEGLPPIPQMMAELQDMTDILLGRDDPPVNNGVSTLMEVADAYFARASEMTMLIQHAEREGTVMKGDNYYRFRTGELRTFAEMCKRAAELGSRRITMEQMRLEAERYGRPVHIDSD